MFVGFYYSLYKRDEVVFKNVNGDDRTHATLRNETGHKQTQEERRCEEE